jgi:hypothetical protein
MVTVTIGDVVGMSHEMRYTREGRPVAYHRPHRAITTPVDGFHLGPAGTFHRMRGYVSYFCAYLGYSRDTCNFRT